jgi:hypothetical protein
LSPSTSLSLGENPIFEPQSALEGLVGFVGFHFFGYSSDNLKQSRQPWVQPHSMRTKVTVQPQFYVILLNFEVFITFQSDIACANFLRLNSSVWDLTVVCLLIVNLLSFFPPPESGQHHNLLAWAIGHRVNLNAVSFLPEYYVWSNSLLDVQGKLWTWRCGDIVFLIFGCGKAYYSNSITINAFV